MSSFGSALGYWYRFHFHGQQVSTETDSETLAEHTLRLLNNSTVPKQFIDALNTSLILYADHGTAASTFAARVTASTRSDSYSAISTAIGTLKGPLHGGANEAAMELISSFNSPQDAEDGIRKMFQRKEKVMGFGHRVYKHGDPRHKIVKDYAKDLCSASEEGSKMFKIAETIENLVVNEKGIHPNVDFYMALLYNRCGIATPLFTPLFVIARTAGWGAHIQEERMVDTLIRPNSEYVGPANVEFVPLDKRN
jgi:2-methylcitrate synthase